MAPRSRAAGRRNPALNLPDVCEEVRADTGGGEQALDYYDYSAKIEITLPPCT